MHPRTCRRPLRRPGERGSPDRCRHKPRGARCRAPRRPAQTCSAASGLPDGARSQGEKRGASAMQITTSRPPFRRSKRCFVAPRSSLNSLPDRPSDDAPLSHRRSGAGDGPVRVLDDARAATEVALASVERRAAGRATHRRKKPGVPSGGRTREPMITAGQGARVLAVARGRVAGQRHARAGGAARAAPAAIRVGIQRRWIAGATRGMAAVAPRFARAVATGRAGPAREAERNARAPVLGRGGLERASAVCRSAGRAVVRIVAGLVQPCADVDRRVGPGSVSPCGARPSGSASHDQRQHGYPDGHDDGISHSNLRVP